MSDLPKADWERIEGDYRAGVLSLREIATKDGHVTEGAIRKKAKKFGWTRDLGARIQAKAEELVRKEAVRNESTQAKPANHAADRIIVEANAEAIANVRLSHRTDIARARHMCLALLGELEAVSEERLTVSAIQDLMETLENPDGSEASEKRIQKAREALDKAMSLPSRAGTVKALSDALKTMITLEREAWDLKTASPDASSPNSVTPERVRELTDERLFELATSGSPRAADPAPRTH